jgi:hypothetical protein
MSYEDPGWTRAGVGAIPFVGRWLIRRSEYDGITNARALFLTFFIALLFVGLVLLSIVRGPGKQGSWPAIVLGVVGLASVYAVQRVRRTPFWRGTDPQRIARQYLTPMVLGIAFGEAPALISFVISVIQRVHWPYLEGLGFAVVNFASIAPTRSDIERRQMQLREAGVSINLGQSLLDLPPSRHGWRGGG